MSEVLFWLALVVLAYTYAGYPVLVWLWGRLAPKPVARADVRPSVAIVVVAHNEAARMRDKLETCLAQDYAGPMRVVVASDGSTDGMNELVESFRDRGVTLLPFPQRRGKAACLNDAVAACDEEVIVFTDARQRLNPQAVRCLVENLADPGVGAVSGELVFVSDDMTPFAEGVDAYWRYEKFIRRQEARSHSVVGVTGALYALRRANFRPIPPQAVLDDVAIPMQVVAQGLRVVFEPRAHAYDRPSRAPQQERLRKVRTLAGNFQLMALYPQLLLPWRNPIWWQFVSHKLMRLVAPLEMLVLLLANLALLPAGRFYQACFALQLLGYALPLLGALVPAVGRWKPTKIARAFLLLNWCVVLGAREFLFNKNAHLWHSRPQAGSAASTGMQPPR
ncbi:glycosyltransferase family 2 protein [Caldimonas thermodepolymerans]|uniref:Cellulose synthase/poly-beta-1,6-N-acetylglucosamine synthase-like glycosyltransferase n=1 Tax=Caldimonas thermodepolymerans TaxID=215580 RepID=A0AA46HXJ1_9BURK|nr:glycosyltransferase family 2 protein [Caldimonas thermodepolymerans]TCP09681.1 cellulose synthase/poly-beta-1,6-N-acetylglucosamine synthase-like glycosyltransferase [Caldimonas thermodepolymerans]UZG49695.1 glycosyltransferase family 2 protein [Caldimonas thermodepolymerans]